MNVVINGEAVTIEGPCSVKNFLAERGLNKLPCAVEVNAHLVPRRDHESHLIRENDRIEVVTLVGGG